jgi:hypothetical protein
MSEDEEDSDIEIARGTGEYMRYLEEDDSKECLWTWGGLMENSVVIYDFRKVV